MQICQPHWDKLREAIAARGLAHLVSRSTGRQMIEDEIAGTPPEQAAHDPLLSAALGIMGKAIECSGLYMMQGDLCPICEAVKHTAGVWKDPKTQEPMTAEQIERWWIDSPAAVELQVARDRGLVPVPQ